MPEDTEPKLESAERPHGAGPGARLRAAREAAGQSRANVSRSLNLDESVVEALENDDVEQLPQPAYVKGYLRAYARLLDLNADELIQAYAGLGVAQPKVLPREPAFSGGERRVSLQVVGGLVILVLIVVSAWWLTRPRSSNIPLPSQVGAPLASQTGSTNAIATSATLAMSPAGKPAIPSVATPARTSSAITPKTPGNTASTPASGATRISSLATTVAASKASAAPAPSQTSSTPSASSTPAAPLIQGGASNRVSSARLALDLTAKSWVQIDDSTGSPLFSGLLKAGVRKTLSGTPPFRVVLGYAPGVKLRIDGKQVDITPYTRSNHTARFTLLADGQTRH